MKYLFFVVLSLFFILTSCQQPVAPEKEPWKEVVFYVFVYTLGGPDNTTLDTIEYTDSNGDTVTLSNVETEMLSWPTHGPTKKLGWKKTVSFDEYQQIQLRVTDDAIVSGSGTIAAGDISGNTVTNASLSNAVNEQAVVDIAGTLYGVVDNDTGNDIVTLDSSPSAGAFTAYHTFQIKMGWAAPNENLVYVDRHYNAKFPEYSGPPVILDTFLSGEVY